MQELLGILGATTPEVARFWGRHRDWSKPQDVSYTEALNRLYEHAGFARPHGRKVARRLGRYKTRPIDDKYDARGRRILGESVASIADDYGVSTVTVYKWIYEVGGTFQCPRRPIDDKYDAYGRYMLGERAADIAGDYGVTVGRVYKWIREVRNAACTT
jgi:transposase-like protein